VTVGEVVLVALVGAYIGFVLGFRYGAYLAYEHATEERA